MASALLLFFGVMRVPSMNAVHFKSSSSASLSTSSETYWSFISRERLVPLLFVDGAEEATPEEGRGVCRSPYCSAKFKYRICEQG